MLALSPAPPAEAFPAYPASWYLFGDSRELRRGPVSRRLLGRLLVAFQTASGRLAVMDGQCAHLGADLGFGDVVGETIRCPFHHWRYGCDGVCASIPGQDGIPPFARLRSYPVEERHGSLFFFNGREPLFPLPFFLQGDPADYLAAKTFRFTADCTWYMNAAHAFDRQHFATVHGRELQTEPVVDTPAPYARRYSYVSKVVGETHIDRILRVVAGHTVKTTLTIWGGTFAVITSDFDRVRTGFLIAMEPLENGHTLCHGIVLAPPSRLPLAWVRRLLTQGYLREEVRTLHSTRYNPASLGPADRDLISFFQWLAALPQKEDHEDIPRSLAPAPDVPAVGLASSAGAARR